MLSINEINSILINKITEAANLSDMLRKIYPNCRPKFKKPWFDTEIYNLKKMYNGRQRRGRNPDLTKDSRSFWAAVGACRGKGKIRVNPIPLTEYENFYASVYPRRMSVDLIFFSNSVPELDGEISILKIITALKKCKVGRVPGADGIRTEFYKNLPSP